MSTVLDSLKQYTTVVSDSGDFNSIEQVSSQCSTFPPRRGDVMFRMQRSGA